MSERTLEGGASRVRVTSSDDSRVDQIVCAGSASRVRVTSSDDSRVDRIACAGSPSTSRLFLIMVRWRDG